MGIALSQVGDNASRSPWGRSDHRGVSVGAGARSDREEGTATRRALRWKLQPLRQALRYQCRVASDPSNAAAAAVSDDKAAQTLSQFIARVLNQLSLSAWLPAAALVLALVYVFQLGAVLGDSNAPSGSTALSATAQRIGDTSIGGAVVIVAAIIVLTVVTQAFSFEAIRTLEGYWGTIEIVEGLAGRRRAHFATKKERLDDAYQSLTNAAWDTARTVLSERQARLHTQRLSAAQLREQAIYTPNVLALVESRIRGQEPTFRATKQEREKARSIRWEEEADPELLRRRVNVDYPVSNRTLPTRVGNILKAHEDAARQPDIESFVQRVFDDLPVSLQMDHDEQRTRLDLYCSIGLHLAHRHSDRRRTAQPIR
jgi:hypothetical protein